MAIGESHVGDAAVARRAAVVTRPRRPWFLMAASLLLVVLSVVLWGKWRKSRDRADRLQAELKDVYAEAEALRTQAARANQRAAQLERDLKTLATIDAKIKKPPAANLKGR